MNKTAVRKIWNLISNELSVYQLRNRLLVQSPIGHILCGILFESSAFSKESFYINAFVQPLYIPVEHLVLTFGIRLPGEWEYDSSGLVRLGRRISDILREQALPFHETFATPELLYGNILRRFSQENIHVHQSLVFTAILLGKIAEARDSFNRLERLVNKADARIPWPRAVLTETRDILNEAITDTQTARERLEGIEIATLKSLKLDDLPRTAEFAQA